MDTLAEPATTPAGADPAAALAERLGNACVEMMDVLSVHLGDRLGWYRSLAAAPRSAEELAAATGTQPRYALEWCRQQVATGLLTEEGEGRYRSAPGVAEVVVDEHSLLYTAAMCRQVVGFAAQVPALLHAYRHGGGVSWEQFGPDVLQAQADMNRPWFERELAGAMASVPELADRLAGTPRIADIGCGAAWSTIAMAEGWPSAHVVGIDVDEPSVALGGRNVEQAGLADRVEVRLADAAALPDAGTFDLVTAFECVHDLPYPVAVLESARRALAPGGAVLVVDEAVGDVPAPPGDLLERLMHGFSILCCLPDSMTHEGSAATGTVMRPATLAGYAHEAGFSRVTQLPVEGFAFFRFTLLEP
ncbi:class I SAM-dependent methyltransferase [Kineococcus sp. SYSU DK003]|uniref:class I SAM-dependent methyltransferase n=1 Tax=Kineococcus sp. SYSU DK003 TaxID=3383124 RepID=UPI003D7E82C5